MACSALLFSVPSYPSSIRLLVFPSLPWLFDAVCFGKFILVAVWETVCHQLCDFFDSAALIYTMRKLAGTLKWDTPHDDNFGEEVLGYL
jgi:hypothetical protein